MKKCILLIALSFFLIFTSCSKDNNDSKGVPEVVAELVFFNYELNTDNHTFVLEYQVKFTNTSKFDAKGFALVYLKEAGSDFTFSSSVSGVVQCPIILAGETCLYEYYDSGDYDPNLVEPGQTLLFAKGEYFFED